MTTVFGKNKLDYKQMLLDYSCAYSCNERSSIVIEMLMSVYASMKLPSYIHNMSYNHLCHIKTFYKTIQLLPFIQIDTLKRHYIYISPPIISY